MGYMEEKTLGNKLDAFIKLYSQDFELGYVDYLGINIPSATLHIGVRPQCGQLKPRMLKIQRFWAYILDFFI